MELFIVRNVNIARFIGYPVACNARIWFRFAPKWLCDCVNGRETDSWTRIDTQMEYEKMKKIKTLNRSPVVL